MILRELLLNVNNNKNARSDKPKDNWFIEQYEKRNENPSISLYN